MPALLALLLLSACPSTEEEPPVPTVDVTAPAPAGHALAAVVPAGVEGAFFGGIGAEGQAGDIKLFNEHVQFVISAVGRRHGWVDVGGTLVDADLVRPSGVVGRDGLDDAFLGFGVSRLFEADTVEVLHDGLDGAAAVVRTVGRDVQWDLFTHGIETPPLIPDLNLAIERTWTLEPGAHAVRVDTTFTNTGDDTVSARPAEGFMSSKEDFEPWYAGHGLVDDASGEVGAAGYVGTHNEGVLSLWGAEPLRVSSATSLLAIASVRLFNHPQMELAPNESLTRTAFYGLGPDTASVEAARRDDLVAVDGVVTDPEGPVEGARVHFERDDEVFGFAVTDAEGRYEAALPAGDWRAWATSTLPEQRVDVNRGAGRFPHLGAPELQAEQLAALAAPSPIAMAGGRVPVGPVPLTVADATTLDLELPSAGRLDLSITRDGAPSSAVIDLHQTDPVSPVPDELREALGLPNPGFVRAWTADGDLSIPLPPGTWTVDVSRSWRDDRVSSTVDLAGVTEHSVALTEELSAEGWVSLDTHLHAAPSMDGRTAMEDRLIACAAVGLDVPVTTDHDRFADYRPLATALGLDDQMTVIPGAEVTAVVRGHWNLFPVEPQGQGARNGGAPVWFDRELTTSDALFERIREAGTEDAFIQVNHGRLALGMMDASGYSVASGQPANERLWSWNFDLMEIITADDVDDWRSNRDDWFSMLQHGNLRVPTGSSDSHDLKRACALGRTDVFVGEGAWTSDDAMDALRAGHLVVASGVTLRANIGDAMPGDTVVGGSQDLDVRVLGPSWLQPGTLRVWQDFVVVHEEVLPLSSTDGVFFDGTIPVVADTDGWIAVEIDDGAPQGLWQGGHAPYAITNAFLLDRDGDGWSSPAR